MEVIIVLYTIESDGLSQNAFELSIPSGREVLLHDIICHMNTITEGNKYYNYIAHVTVHNRPNPIHSIQLVSPADVVPICPIEGFIKLTLIPSNIPPLVPVDQLSFRQDISRREIYGKYYQTGPPPAHVYESIHKHNINSNNHNHSSNGMHRQTSSSSGNGGNNSSSSVSAPVIDAFDPFGSTPMDIFDEMSSQPTRSSSSSSSSSSTPIGTQQHQKKDQSKPPKMNGHNNNNSKQTPYSDSSSSSTGDRNRSRTHSDIYGHSNSNGQDRDPRALLERAHSNNDTDSSFTSNIFSIGMKSLSTLSKTVSEGVVQASALVSEIGETAIQGINDVVQGEDGTSGSKPKELRMSRYEIRTDIMIAEGGFGRVYLARSISAPVEAPPQFALKQILLQSREQIEDAQLELKYLQQFGSQGTPHQHIIELLDSCQQQSRGSGNSSVKNMYYLFPLYPDGTAWDVAESYFYNNKNGSYPFDEKNLLGVMKGVASALHHMHRHGVAHRDMKPHNVLLRPSNRSKVGYSYEGVLMDFGSCSDVQVKVTSRRQAVNLEEEAESKTSAAYRPPELTNVDSNCIIDGGCDMWGFGCSLYCLAYGHSPFESLRDGVLRLAILNCKYEWPAKNRNTLGITYSTENFVNLVNLLLAKNSAERPSAAVVHAALEKFFTDGIVQLNGNGSISNGSNHGNNSNIGEIDLFDTTTTTTTTTTDVSVASGGNLLDL